MPTPPLPIAQVAWESELILSAPTRGQPRAWQPSAVRNLLRVLPEFKRCTLLQLDGNTHFGSAGCKGECFGILTAPLALSLRYSRLQLVEGLMLEFPSLAALCEVLRLGDDGMACLKDLRMSACGIGDAGGMALSHVLPDGPESLSHLECFRNSFTSETLWALLKCQQLKQGMVVKCEKKSVKVQNDHFERAFDREFSKNKKKEEEAKKKKKKSLVKDGSF